MTTDMTTSTNPDDPDSPIPISTSNEAEKQPALPPGPTFPEGSLWGWLTLTGSWLILFATFGYANTFGVFQAYYATGYPNETASNISWVGSVQLFLQFSLGAVVGPLYDRGYFYSLTISGSVVYIVCLFMTSLAKKFWQTVLAQAIGVGIGIGVLFLPALSVISHYFRRRRALAIGIAVTGSSVGGICLPIMLNNLILSHGFSKAVQYTGYLIMACLIVGCALMRPRLPPNAPGGPKPTPKQLFANRSYAFCVAGLFFTAWGLFFPIYYLQVFAESHHISPNITYYTLAILNAASVFGRITPNFLADIIGPLNLMASMCLCTSIIAFAVFGASTPAGLIIVAILYGFFSGAYVSLLSPALISFAENFHEIGIRIGMGMLALAFAALTGTPITGALLDKYGFYAPIIWSGLNVAVGGLLLSVATVLERRKKGTWKV